MTKMKMRTKKWKTQWSNSLFSYGLESSFVALALMQLSSLEKVISRCILTFNYNCICKAVQEKRRLWHSV
jgi:hypothetical protein